MDNLDASVRTILVRTLHGERRSPWFRRVLLSGVQADCAAVCADPDAVLDVEQAAIVLGCSAGTVKSQTSGSWP
jgi:hypothetical protein